MRGREREGKGKERRGSREGKRGEGEGKELKTSKTSIYLLQLLGYSLLVIFILSFCTLASCKREKNLQIN